MFENGRKPLQKDVGEGCLACIQDWYEGWSILIDNSPNRECRWLARIFVAPLNHARNMSGKMGREVRPSVMMDACF